MAAGNDPEIIYSKKTVNRLKAHHAHQKQILWFVDLNVCQFFYDSRLF